MVDCTITSAVTGVENAVWGHLGHFYDINAWIPKNLTFARAAALESLSAEQRRSLVRLVAQAEERGWAMSREAAAVPTAELRRRGLAVRAPSSWLLVEFKRLAERFSLEWVREVGPLANRLLIPYYTRQ